MKRKMLLIALSCALLASGGEAATPLTVSQSATTTFSFAAVTDSNSGAPTAVTNYPSKSVQFDAFTPGLGILTSAGVTTQASPAWSVGVQTQSNGNPFGAEATGTATARLTLASAFSLSGTSSVTVTDTCPFTGCFAAPVSKPWTASISSTLSGSQLAPLYSSPRPTFTLSGRLEVDYATTVPFGLPGRTEGTISSASPLTTTLTYSYLKHAGAALDIYGADALTIDFGDVLLGAAPVSRIFGLFNIGDDNTAALDLDRILGVGNGVSLNLTPAAGLLDAGEFKIGRLAFDPTTAGLFSRTITLQTSDADVGIGLQSKTLTLNLRANVIAAVPEPTSWALLIGGFGIVGGALRRRAAAVSYRVA